MKWKNAELDQNMAYTSLVVFMESYNQKAPAGFPKATEQALKKFQRDFPALFKKGSQWSIGKHRKRLMDWLSTHEYVS